MKDLRSRWNLLFVILALGVMLGCGAMQGGTRTNPNSTSLAASAPTVDFGTVVVGSNALFTDYISNPTTAAVTVMQATMTGRDFQINPSAFPMTIPSGARAPIEIGFAPQATGDPSGTLLLASTAPQSSMTLTLTGKAVRVGHLAPNPSSFSFGNVALGQSQTSAETLTNIGDTAVTIRQIVASDSDFAVQGLTLPVVLQPNETASFNVVFSPKSGGNCTGRVSVSAISQADPKGPTGHAEASNSGGYRWRRRQWERETLTIAVAGVGTSTSSTPPAAAPGLLSATPGTVSFGTIQMANDPTLPLVVTNSGGSSVSITQAAASGPGFSLTGPTLPLALATGQSATFSVVFTPSGAGSANGNVTITSNASNPTLMVPVTANVVTPGTLSAGAVAFGTVQVGNTQNQTATVTNTGGSSVTISQASVTGAGFGMSSLTLPMTLSPNQSANISLSSSPKSAGAMTGSLNITSNASNASLAVPLSATAVAAGALTISPSSFPFGSVQVGATQTLPGTLTNSGGSSVTVTQAAVGSSAYSVTGLKLPLTLNGGQSAPFSVVFTPQSAGAANVTLTITSNAPNPSLTAAVTGTGVTPGALSASPSSLNFNSVQVGNSSTLPETLTNTGGSDISLTQAAAGGGYTVTGLTLPMTLAPGKSTSFNVVFAPQSTGSSSVNLAITTNNPASTLSIPLIGSGASAGSLSAGPVSFGSVQVGNSSTQKATLSNTGGSSVVVNQANLTGSAFTMSGLTLPLTLNGGQSFTFSVGFTPKAAGSASGSIAIVSTASTSPTIALSGTGTAAGQLSVSPGSFPFGSVTVGASKNMSASLSATGSSVTVTSASTSSNEFSISGPSLPMTIQPGSPASFTLTFTPQASGAATANVSFATSSSNTPVSESLSGNGVAPPQHSVALSWNASTSTVSSYNVYRGSTTGGPYAKLNSTAGTTYTDNAVQAGQSYYYVTSAVANDGMESTFSNEVHAVIPTP